MNDTHAAVLAMLRAALFDRPLDLPGELDWAAADQELRLQGVLMLCGDVTAQLDSVPDELQTKWSCMLVQQIKRYYAIMARQSELVSLLREAGIEPVILKGTATAAYYPKPEYRPIGDVDLMVRPEQYEDALRLMLENGYQAVHQYDVADRHVEMLKAGVYFELHRYFATYHDAEHASAMDAAIYAAMDAPVVRESEGYSFPALPPLAMGLLLLEHINHHIVAELGLRQVSDWAVFVSRQVNDEYWSSEFCAAARSVGLETLAVTVTRMCQIYLGLPEEDCTWCAGADARLCDELMEYILECGEFGRKEERDGRAANMIRRSKGLTGLFRHLQNSGCRNWKLIRRFPWLKCMAWLYQIFRSVRLWLLRDHPFRRLKDDYHLYGFFIRLGVARHGRGIAARTGEIKTDDGDEAGAA